MGYQRNRRRGEFRERKGGQDGSLQKSQGEGRLKETLGCYIMKS